MRMEQIIRFAINTYGNFASVLLRDSDRVVCVLQMIPVAANDVAFSIHAVLLTGITLIQVLIYDSVFMALPTQSGLWLIYVFKCDKLRIDGYAVHRPRFMGKL
ncbi:hypothetical protein IFM89_035579 [Coptis chinensis]|uniref:Uncharacterized protein n=1 Tax=Coptis chinensis TaxID=261450 RepID=A0A835HXB6_9MAGN|nr:hypothetical protein IFM89_035579 [Coptis chinensis]